MKDYAETPLRTPPGTPSQAAAQAGSNQDDLTRRLELVAGGLARVPEAKDFLGIGKSLLYSMMDAGELPYVLVHGCRCIPRRALQQYAAEHVVQRQGA